MNNHDPLDPALRAKIDDLIDHAVDVIMSAPRVFVRPRSARLTADLRARFFGERGELRRPETSPGDPERERIVYFAANVLVGLLHQSLVSLGRNPDDNEALSIVSEWLQRCYDRADHEDESLSPVHMILRARPHVLPADPLWDGIERTIRDDGTREMLALLANVSRSHRHATATDG